MWGTGDTLAPFSVGSWLSPFFLSWKKGSGKARICRCKCSRHFWFRGERARSLPDLKLHLPAACSRLISARGLWEATYAVEDLQPVVPSRHVDPALEDRDPGGAAVGAHGGHHRPPGREKRELRRGSPHAATRLSQLCQLFQDRVSVILLPLPALFLFLLKSLLSPPCIKARSCGEGHRTALNTSPTFSRPSPWFFFFLSPSGATSLAAAGGEAEGRRELLLVGFWRVGLHGVEGGVPVVPSAHVDLAVQHHRPHRAATSRTP